jgi:hypothetical protein
MMAKEHKNNHDKAAVPPDQGRYPHYEHMVTAGFDSLNAMGAVGWQYVDMWDAPGTVTQHGPVQRVGTEPFFIWRRELP